MRLSLWPARRNFPARGSNKSAKAVNGHFDGDWGGLLRASVVIGVVMVMVTLVEPAPEAMPAGEKVTVAPVGRLAAESVMAAGRVVAGETRLTVMK